jgi:hypothetical protein
VAALRATAQQQWARDNRDQAMAAVSSALKLKPSDAETSRLASGFVRQMSERASKAASAARNAGAPDSPGSALDNGRRRVRDAAGLEREGKPDQSIRAYGDALDLFAKAIATATGPGGATPPAPTTGAPTGTATASTNAAGTSAAGGGPPIPTPSVVRPAPVPVEAPPPAAAPSPTPAAPTPAAPTPAAPAPTTPANVTSAARVAAEESAVRQVLQRYRSGYESLSASAVQAVYPGINVTALADVFKLYSSLKQDLEIDRVEIDGQTATVTGSVTTAPVVKTGRAAPKKSKAVFRLRKTGDAWLIQDVSLK